MTKCFFLEECPGVHQFSLRRFTFSDTDPKCVGDWGHEARVDLGRHPDSFASELHEGKPSSGDFWPHDDPRWPPTCSRCAYAFKAEDEWQLFVDSLFKRFDTGEILTINDAPVGAMWWANWMSEERTKLSCDGQVLAVKLPGGHAWYPEQRASNCDSPCKTCVVPWATHWDKTQWNKETKTSTIIQPKDPRACGSYIDSRPHMCWVRHGTPPHQVVHVDKSGVTCGAGAGSIALPNWHGFLHNGELVG